MHVPCMHVCASVKGMGTLRGRSDHESWSARLQSAAGKGRGMDAGVKEGGMPPELQLPHPHSHFSAHEWGEGWV